MELFINTESANFGDGIVGCSSLDDGPVDGVWDILPYELSDINTQSCATPLLILCVYITIVLVYPGLNWVIGRPSVGLPVAYFVLTEVKKLSYYLGLYLLLLCFVEAVTS